MCRYPIVCRSGYFLLNYPGSIEAIDRKISVLWNLTNEGTHLSDGSKFSGYHRELCYRIEWKQEETFALFQLLPLSGAPTRNTSKCLTVSSLC